MINKLEIKINENIPSLEKYPHITNKDNIYFTAKGDIEYNCSSFYTMRFAIYEAIRNRTAYVFQNKVANVSYIKALEIMLENYKTLFNEDEYYNRLKVNIDFMKEELDKNKGTAFMLLHEY